jgi:hypothetical protein
MGSKGQSMKKSLKPAKLQKQGKSDQKQQNNVILNLTAFRLGQGQNVLLRTPKTFMLLS